MFLKLNDGEREVCMNMDTGLRFRPARDKKTGMVAGVLITFPDGNTQLTVRGDYDRVCAALNAQGTAL